MKFQNIYFIAIAVLLFFTSINLSAQDDRQDFSLAKVGEKVFGVYIFVSAEPYHPYDYVATVDAKVSWTGKTKDDFEDIIEKAKKKYSNFNGMIFHSGSLDKADLIRFQDLEVSRGGLKVGQKVSFINMKRVYYGSVVELETSKGRASVNYLDVFEEEKVKKILYTDLTPLSDEMYATKKAEFQKEVDLYKFSVGQKLTWVRGKKSLFGEVVSLDDRLHKASLKHFDIYGEEKTSTISYLDLKSITEEEFQSRESQRQEDVKRYTFSVGEKVSWVRETGGRGALKQFKGEVIELSSTLHKASVKYLDERGKEQIVKISYLDLTKI